MANSIYNKSPPTTGLGGIIQQQLAKSLSITAATAYTITNPGAYSRLSCFFSIHSFPGSASTTANIAFLITDPVSGANVSVNSPGAARSATGTTMYQLGLGVTTSGNAATNCILGRTMVINISLSTGATSKDVVFSLGLEWFP